MTNEKVITILNSLKQYYNDKNEDSYVGFDDEDNEALDYVINLLKQTRWIPCSERLPEEQRTIGKYVFSENVLGTEGYTIRRAYYNYTTKEWFDGNEEMEWTEITHWMPLPEEPPKAESEGEE